MSTTPNTSKRAAGEAAALRERLSRLSAASLRINESMELDTVLQDVLDDGGRAEMALASGVAARPVDRYRRFLYFQ